MQRFVTRQLAAIAIVLGFIGGMTPTASAATISVKASTLTDHSCDGTEWHFVITQLSDYNGDGKVNKDDAPSMIEIDFVALGTTALLSAVVEDYDVLLDKVTGHTAHYSTSANLNYTVADATADIHPAWVAAAQGQFNLSHGPCNITVGGGGGGGGGSTNATPELDSFVLFGAGALGLAGYTWKRRRPARVS